ncbi:ArsR/SmtB family transcription factor [Nocardiopsis quinghaiensis]|uniref:ArsR/SmtB family transcription factor n=1 Tax=Nocardiopsis quinghaiensis TaxID=464995 RepID=UPI001CC23A78|nr:metalloregulator ArsR/SmtB family transcription factor [Nocardiopsis quinghaiensis]
MYEALPRTGKALAHGKRLEIVEVLAQGERPVQELAGTVGLKPITASAHLQVLCQAELVAVRNEGTRIFYRLAGDDVAALTALRPGRGHPPCRGRSDPSHLPGRGGHPYGEA